MKTLKELEMPLRGKTYAQLQTEMSELPNDVLVKLLDARSTRVGDTASSVINQRNADKLVAEAVLQRKCTTETGRVRAISTLWMARTNTPTGEEALIQLARDANWEVGDTAVMAIVAMRRASLIPRLEEIKADPGQSAEIIKQLDLAIEALQKSDPQIYCPEYGEP